MVLVPCDEIDRNHIKTQLRYLESNSNSYYDNNYDLILMPWAVD
jgi:hypothetical protein